METRLCVIFLAVEGCASQIAHHFEMRHATAEHTVLAATPAPKRLGEVIARPDLSAPTPIGFDQVEHRHLVTVRVEAGRSNSIPAKLSAGSQYCDGGPNSSPRCKPPEC